MSFAVRCVRGAARSLSRAGSRSLTRAGFSVAALAALAVAGCQTDQPGVTASVQPRGATVAFDSIDGLPSGQFRTLVDNLNQEAESRRVAVLPRAQTAAYRVRGYFAAAVEKGRTTVSWVFDVFDRDEHRALRISGSGPVSGKDWAAADAGLLQKVAQSSMNELAGFLTSPVAIASRADNGARLALASDADGSPEAAGIFRVAHTDPVPGRAAADNRR
jgi:hypothetical protein